MGNWTVPCTSCGKKGAQQLKCTVCGTLGCAYGGCPPGPAGGNTLCKICGKATKKIKLQLQNPKGYGS